MVLEVRGRHYQKTFLATMQDISQGGMALSTSQSLVVGDRFPVEFVLPDGRTTIACSCEVVWKRRLELQSGTTESIGVRFLDLGGEKLRPLDAWIQTALKETNRS